LSFIYDNRKVTHMKQIIYVFALLHNQFKFLILNKKMIEEKF